MGAKKAPAYRIVVADSRSRGTAGPLRSWATRPHEGPVCQVHEEKALIWLSGRRTHAHAKAILSRAGSNREVGGEETEVAETQNHGSTRRANMLRDLVTFIAQAIVDEPDKVQVNEVEGERAVVFGFRVSPEDMVRSSAARAGSSTP